MKKNLLVVTAILGLGVLFSGFSLMYPTGAPAGYTGSPGDNAECTQCHGGTATTVTGIISTNIPAAGYTPGSTYQITVTNNLTGSGKYGFELSPQKTDGTQVGTLVAGTGSKLVGGTKYITHSNATASTSSWTFGWTAPASGSGTVNFYAAIAKNKPGPVAKSSISVNEAVALPAGAGPISGPVAVCQGTSNNYSVGTISGATGYVWSVPSGASITSGQNTTSVIVSFSNTAVSGNISVYGTNGAGNGAPSNLGITVNPLPTQPSEISGSASVCQNSDAAYSVSNVPGTTYTWTVPSGYTIISGQGSNSILISIGAVTGELSVTAHNSCGISPARTKTITPSPLPVKPANIQGVHNVDLRDVITSNYSTEGAQYALQYEWSVSPENSGTMEGNSNNATITWNQNFTGVALIKVRGVNDCGNGDWSQIFEVIVTKTTGVEFDKSAGLITPNPSDGTFKLNLNEQYGDVEVIINDFTGKTVLRRKLSGSTSYSLTTDLANGVYLLTIESKDKSLITKLVVNR